MKLARYFRQTLLISSFWAFAVIGVIPVSVSAEPFFSDGFESADLSQSENGFRWTDTKSVSIVRDDQFRVWINSGSIQDGPYVGREWENGPGSDGRHAMRFYYRPEMTFSEQRFSLGGAYPELWMSFWLRVPINFSYGPTGSPNKLLAVWMDGYEATGDGSTIWLGFLRSGADSATFAVTSTDGRNTGAKGFSGVTGFISVPEDRGRWMQLVIHMKAESSEDAGDGFVKVWRRWETQSAFAQTHNYLNQRIRMPANGPKGFSSGYVMGWANAAYTEDTEFLMDDFRVSQSPLLDVAAVPQPPNNISAQ